MWLILAPYFSARPFPAAESALVPPLSVTRQLPPTEPGSPAPGIRPSGTACAGRVMAERAAAQVTAVRPPRHAQTPCSRPCHGCVPPPRVAWTAEFRRTPPGGRPVRQWQPLVRDEAPQGRLPGWNRPYRNSVSADIPARRRRVASPTTSSSPAPTGHDPVRTPRPEVTTTVEGEAGTHSVVRPLRTPGEVASEGDPSIHRPSRPPRTPSAARVTSRAICAGPGTPETRELFQSVDPERLGRLRRRPRAAARRRVRRAARGARRGPPLPAPARPPSPTTCTTT